MSKKIPPSGPDPSNFHITAAGSDCARDRTITAELLGSQSLCPLHGNSSTPTRGNGKSLLALRAEMGMKLLTPPAVPPPDQSPETLPPLEVIEQIEVLGFSTIPTP